MHRDWAANIVKVCGNFVPRSIKAGLAPREEQDTIEEFEGRSRRLMNGGDYDNLMLLRHRGYVTHDFSTCCGVKATSRLVKEQNLGRGDQLAGNTESAFLTSADALLYWSAHDSTGLLL